MLFRPCLPDELFRRSVWRIILNSSLPLVMVFAAAALSRWGEIPWVLKVPLQFCLMLAAQRCMQTLVHDSSHKFFSVNTRWNDVVGNLLAAGMIGTKVESYRSTHFQHHKYNGSQEDPEYISPAQISKRGGLKTFMLRYALGLEAPRLFRKYHGEKSGAKVPQAPQVRQAWTTRTLHFVRSRWHIAFDQAILLGFFWFFAGEPYLYFLWLYIALSWSPLLSGLRFLAEHPGNTDRTVTTLAPFWERVYFAPLDFNYHFEHHLFPTLPPYGLRKAHAVLERHGVFRDHPEFVDTSFIRSLGDTFR